MHLHYHDELQATTPYPGVSRLICMDQALGAGAITQGLATIEPGATIRPHTHLVEDTFTILRDDVRVLVGDEVIEVRGRPATFLAPGNTMHAIRNVGGKTIFLPFAQPSVGVASHLVDVDDARWQAPSGPAAGESAQHVQYHDELQPDAPYSGCTQLITMDRWLGAGAITQGIVTIGPGAASRPHTHRVEESMMLLQGDVRILVGDEVAEVRGRQATFLAPANTVHAIRNIGETPVVLCFAYPSVDVALDHVTLDF
jgi:quercetin dioxygenase-like cupin family protein